MEDLLLGGVRMENSGERGAQFFVAGVGVGVGGCC